MGKKTRVEAGELPRPNQDGAVAPLPRRPAGGERQRDAAARLERFAHTPGRASDGKMVNSGGPLVVAEDPCVSPRPGEGLDQTQDPGNGSGIPAALGKDHVQPPLHPDQPTLKDVLAAVHKCNDSLAALSTQVGSIQEGLGTLRHDVQKIRERTAALEGRVSEAADDIHHLQADLGTTSRTSTLAYDRVEDLENRLRRNNLRVVGVPEKIEGSSAAEFIETWLRGKFGATVLSPLFAVERAHRVPMRPLPPGNPPRAMLVRILNCRDRDVILRKAREVEDLSVDGQRVSIFPDFSAEVQKRRLKFVDVKKRLRDLHLPYAMLYPAKLRVVADGETHFFETVAGAVAWLDTNVRRLRAGEGRAPPR